MSSTITLQNTLTWAEQFIYSQPGALGSANEPAITIANIVKQAILGPPFAWAWNRAVPTAVSLSTGAGDFSIGPYTDFGFIEKAWISDGSTITEVNEIVTMLAKETVEARPCNALCILTDDNAGDYVARISPTPDSAASYTLQFNYQKKATLFSSLSGTWAPIPDELSYIYQYGFLGMLLAFKKDPRSQIYDARFIAHLLGNQGGLSEMQKNIFLGKWLSTALEVGAANMKTQMGVQGRGQ